MDRHTHGHGGGTPESRSSELLGFPPDARVLIVNCDDLGMDPQVNAGVFDAIEHGIATSCSLMVPCPAAAAAMDVLARRPDIPFGVHLTLVRDTPQDRWGPVAGASEVPSLLDATGGFFVPTPDGRAALAAKARTEDVEREFRAQIDTVAAAGLAPTHLDFHCLADGGRPDILDLTVSLAAEYGLAVRVWLDPARGELRRRGLPVTDNDFLDSFSLALDGKREHYERLLAALEPGLTEWAVHPAAAGDTPVTDHGRRVRRSDHAFLTSPAARALVDGLGGVGGLGVHLTDYRPLRQVWAAANPGG